jgi:uncharacterized damage-inducible protein DinB
VSASPAHRSTPLIDRYMTGGPILAYAVTGMNAEHERARPGPGAWSIAEVVAHIVDCDLVFADRMKRVIAEENPPLSAFDENAWAARLFYQEIEVTESVSLLAANRRALGAILRRLSDADFARHGTHSEAGKVTLADLLAKAVNHVDHHLRFLYAKRAQLGVALPPRYGSEALGTLVMG